MPGQPRVIIAIDPGGTTGVAWCRITNPESESHHVGGYVDPPMQFPDCNTDPGLQHLIANLGGLCRWAEPFTGKSDDVHIVVERFEDRPEERYRDKIDYTAAEVIGALRLWCIDRPYIKRVYQSASHVVSDTKAFWSDDKVKTLGLWVPNYRHAMDATRHLLHYRLFTLGHKDLLEPFRPTQYPFE